MANTSFRLDSETQEILRILGVPFVKIFRKGLVAYGIEGKIRDPRVQILVKRYQQELISELEAENSVLENLITGFDKKESDVQDIPKNPISEVIERSGVLSPSMAEMMEKDPIIPVNFARNIITEYLKQLDKYDGNLQKVKADIEGSHMEEADRAAWIIVSGRADLEKILESGLRAAMRVKA